MDSAEAERESMLLHAETAIARCGVAGLTVEGVAQSASRTPDEVRAVLGDRQAILDALFIAGHRSFTASDIQPGPDPVEDIRRGLAMYREWAIEHPIHYRLMFVARGDGYEPSPEAGAIGWRNLEALTARMARAVAAGQLVGTPLGLALHLWGAAHGYVMIELFGPGPFHDRPEMLYEEAIDRVIAAHAPGSSPSP